VSRVIDSVGQPDFLSQQKENRFHAELLSDSK
jgi:hypothetical protein